MLKKKYLLFTATLSIGLFSCAPLQQTSYVCSQNFQQIKSIDNKLPDKFTFQGAFYFRGLPAIIRGDIDQKESINVYTPFGKNIVSLEKENNNICVKLEGKNECNKEEVLNILSLYFPDLNTILNFSFRNLVIGKFNLKDDDKFSCENNKLIVDRKDYKLVYQNDKLEKILYGDFAIEYLKDNGNSKEIEIKTKDTTLAKINISQIKNKQ